MKRTTVSRSLWAFLLCLPVLLFGLATPGAAQGGGGSISGSLTDSTGAALRSAQVSIPAHGMHTTSDQQGLFLLSDLPAGTYTVVVTYIGFDTLTKTVAVTAGQIATMNLQLKVASQNQKVLVTATSASAEVEALNVERAADNVLQVLPVQAITSLPMQNVGNAIGRMPSVTLSRNEGEDQFVEVRGTEPRLTNTTVDGFNMPSEDPGLREFDFSAIPAGIVDSIQVSKTLQANMDGDGIGGSVNLITKTATDTPTYQFTALGGYTPINNGRPNTDEYGTWGRRFGASKKFGFITGGEYSWEGTGIHDIEAGPDVATLPNGSTKLWFSAMDVRLFSFHRPRWGVAGSLDYRVKPGSTITLRYFYSAYHDFGDKTVYTLHDNTPGIILLNPGNSGCAGTPDANGATTPPCNTAPSYFNQNEHITQTVGSVQLSGAEVRGSTWYTWSAAIGRGTWGPGWDTGRFASSLATTSCQYDSNATTNWHLPQWSPGCFDEISNPQNQVLSDVNLERGESTQINLGLEGSGAFRYHLGRHISTLEYGAKFRNLHKYANTYKIDIVPTIDNISMSMFPNGLKISNYYNGSYKDGYNAFFSPIANYMKQHPTQFITSSNSQWEDPSDYGMVERIPAFYVMNSIDFARGVRLVLGLRAEITTDTVHNLAFGNDGSVTPNKASGSYYDVQPSASLRFNAGANSFLRLIYSRGISRPEEQSIAQPLDWTINGNGSHNFQVSFGNPNLKAETGDDLDVLYDHYFKTFGVFSAGYFYKHLGLPIITTQTTLNNYLPPNAPPQDRGTYLATTPVNAGSAWVSGIELQYIQHYANLPGFLGGLGMKANYSNIGSQTSGIPNRSDRPRLLYTSPNMYNIGPTYDRGRLSMNMNISYNQASIFAYQYETGTPGGLNGPLSDVYFYNHTQVDAQGSVTIRPGLKLIVSGRNLTNEVFGFYQGSQQYQIQREYYQPTYSFGLSWTPKQSE
ncbi:MAG: TonB-dependent receptor [Acidobacteriaceae bacterium]